MTRQTYATDITDSEWSYLEPHLPAPKSGGRPRRHAVREILNAIFYVLRSGCVWRLLPHDLPPWKTVYHYFRLDSVVRTVALGPGWPPCRWLSGWRPGARRPG